MVKPRSSPGEKFQDVTYKVIMKGEKSLETTEKYILHGVSGSINPGEILALIAPSGGGKTTLLNLLSGRLKINSGTITYNGQPYSKSFKQRYVDIPNMLTNGRTHKLSPRSVR
ncbi:hypothetical protein Ancab_035039 [Ancistrocladus abbreviatus]